MRKEERRGKGKIKDGSGSLQCLELREKGRKNNKINTRMAMEAESKVKAAAKEGEHSVSKCMWQICHTVGSK